MVHILSNQEVDEENMAFPPYVIQIDNVVEDKEVDQYT